MWEHVRLPWMQRVSFPTLLFFLTANDLILIVRHRGAEFAILSGEDCPDGCGSCVDHMGGLALPSPCSIMVPSSASDSSPLHPPIGTQGHSHTYVERPAASMSTLDHFYAIAALLPPPPPSSRTIGPGTLDPTNVTVYRQPFGKSVQKQDWQKAAGLVQVPPLNCCAGRCKCPGGMCGCGTECGGGCGRRKVGSGKTKGNERENVSAEFDGVRTGNRVAKPTGGNCCTGKKATAGVPGNPTAG